MDKIKGIILRYKLKLSFGILFVAIFFVFGYNNIISTGPCSLHAWRQSDSYSFALTYYYQNNKLLEPEILFIGERGHGKTVSEFPILYYLTAQIWKITGVTPAVLKFMNFLILLIGLYHLALLAKNILEDNFWTMVVVLFLYSSPLLGYYSFNFVPNIPAFGLALTGLYYLYYYAKTLKTKFLIIYTLIFAFASLIKVTALFSLLGGTAVMLLYFLNAPKKYRFVILKVLVSFLVIFGIYWLWYKYSLNYNSKNLKGIFNQSTMPIWKLDAKKIEEIFNSFYHNVFPQYFNRLTSFITLFFIWVILTFRKKINKHLLRSTIIFFIGFLLFIILFFRGLNKHDYFLINTLILFPAVILATTNTLKNLYPNIYSSKLVKSAVALFLILLLNHSMVITRSHYNTKDKLVKYNIPLTKRQRDFWDYNFHNLKKSDFQYQGIHKYLSNIGIDYDDKVISLGDYTPNHTLSLMHRHGFSEYHYSWNYEGKEMIDRMIELGASYLIVREDLLNKEYLKPYTLNEVGKYNNIFIFKLS